MRCGLRARCSRSRRRRSRRLASRLDGRFLDALRLILACRGRVVVTGIGKSGQIGRKIASTLASTGTPSFFVHPARRATATSA